jgi:hypothetical protein
MVGHLDRGRSVAGQAPRRAKTDPQPPARSGDQPPSRRNGPRNEGAPLAGKPWCRRLNCFDLLWPFSLIARHELFRTSQNERPGIEIQPSMAPPVGFILLMLHIANSALRPA